MDIKQRPLTRVFTEGVIAGLILIVFFYIAQVFIDATGLFEVKTPQVCDRWNDKYILEATLLLSAVLFQFVSEYSGLNNYYCKVF